VEEILRSQARIDWSEKEELDRYFTTEGPIAQVKYDAWDCFQKPRLRGRAFELDYHSLRGHALWVGEEHRKQFHSRQIRQADADEPLAAVEAVVQRKPDDAEGHLNLGYALLQRGRLEEAVTHFQQALRLKPSYAEAYHHLARALAKQQRSEEAILCYRQALRLRPDYAEAQKCLGDELGRRRGTTLDEAIASYREAIRLKPDYAAAHSRLGCMLREMGELDEALRAHRRACELRPDVSAFHSCLLYCLHFHPDSGPELIAREHDCWNTRHAEPLAPLIQPHWNDPDPNRRLRIGYVSPHFSSHVVGRFLLPLVEGHDRDQFEIFCYASLDRRPDQLTARFQSRCDHWHDVGGLTDQDLANLVRQHQIDILVDLDAHMEKRLLTFARKPAPVQVTYLGYCSTTGLRVMDYRLTDPFLDPPGQPHCYSEESVNLPETYWCYEPPEDLPPVGPLPALSRGHVTFGCLNNFCKVTLPTLTVWRDLLCALPGSRLILHARPGTHRERVLRFLAEEGVDSGRVEFAGLTRTPQYFERYSQIDIGLDPFPYAGGTTTCDALWMGVPVVSLAGKTAVGRGGLSILSNIGLPELVAQTPVEYIGICKDLAADWPRLGSLRAGLRQRLLGSPLMNAARFVRNVEAAYRMMWQRWCAQTANGRQQSTTCLAERI
jgi:predicted O-linked N-acetylglucosamine transferase (SPINDLY family)